MNLYSSRNLRCFCAGGFFYAFKPHGGLNHSLENGIVPLEYSSPFGTYELSIKNEPGRLLVYRKLLLNNSIQPKEQFVELLRFLKNIAKADKTKLVLAKGT